MVKHPSQNLVLSNLPWLDAPLPRRAAVRPHRRHQIRTLPEVLEVA